MVDGELDPASVRRVLVHSEVCPSCRGFLDGIRTQMRAHRDLADAGLTAEGTDFEAPANPRAEALREQLVRNREQLGRILYEVGRGYVLMGMSPSFSRLVAREPVPIPDMSMRGRHLLDEVARLTAGEAGSEWVRARELFAGGELRTPNENMAKGKRLLNEALMVRPDFHEARIYLGHAYHVSEERELARREFKTVLETAGDVSTRAFALENLGNVYLEEGQHQESIEYFEALVESGVIADEPRFFTAYFNLALAYGLMEDFESCRLWLKRLYDEFPHKRRLIKDELLGRPQLVETLRRFGEVDVAFAADFPGWFPLIPSEAC